MTVKEKLELCIYRMNTAIAKLESVLPYHDHPGAAYDAKNIRHALSHCQSTKQTLEIMLQEMEEGEKIQEFSPLQEET